MPRPIQSLTLSFGLISVPVRLYTAAKSKAVSFHWLSPEGQRVRQRLYAPSDEAPAPAQPPPQLTRTRGIAQETLTPTAPVMEQEIARDTLLKGYEVAPDQYVSLTPDELKALEEAANRQAEIQEFVPLETVDPTYIEKTYYLGPEKGAEKVYCLLARALRLHDSAAIAKVVMRGKEKMVLIRGANEQDVMILETLFWADEVRELAELQIPDVALKDAEVNLAGQLVESLSSRTWAPEKYHDTYRERVLELIRKKQEGQENVAPLPQQSRGEVLDLMEALKRSLEHSEGKKKEPIKATQKEKPRRQRKAS
jgi:DNA end-binding protein Ku